MKMIQDLPLHLIWKKDQKYKKDFGVENMKIIQDLPLHLMWNKKTKSISKTLDRKHENYLGLTTPSDVEKRKKNKQDSGVELFTDHSI